MKKVFNYLVYLTVFGIPLFFLPFFNNSYELPKVVFLRTMVLLMVFFFVLYLAKTKKLTVFDLFREKTVRRILFGALFILIFATIFSVAPKLSFWGTYYRIQGLYTILHYFIFFLLLISVFHKDGQWQTAKKFLFLGVFVSAIYGIFQFFGLDFSGYNLQEISLGRIIAGLGHPNYLGYYIILALFPMISFWLPAKKKWLMTAGIILAMVALVLTGSRGALLGFFAGLFLFLFLIGIFYKKRWLADLAVLVPILMIGVVLIANVYKDNSWVKEMPLLNRLVASEENLRSLHVRGLVGTSTLKMIGDRPILGYGPETFSLAFQKYSSPEILKYERLSTIPDKPHNTFLEVGANTGLVGILFYIFSLAAIFKLAISRLKKLDKKKKLEVIGVVSSLSALFVADLVGFSMTAHFVITVFWLAYLVFLLSGKPITKTLPGLKNKFYSGLLIAITAIFVIASIVLQNVFYALADYEISKGLSIDNFETAVTLQPNQRDYYYVLAAIYFQNGDLPKALAAVEKAGDFVSHQEAYYYFLLGKIYGTNCGKDCGKAEDVYWRANRLAPTYPPILLNWGIMYADNGNCAKALLKFKDYLRLVPDYWQKKGTEEYRLFYKDNPDFDQVFEYQKKCEAKG